MTVQIEIITGIITERLGPEVGLASDMKYKGNMNLPDGPVLDVVLPDSVAPQWPDPIEVRALPVGTAFIGARVGEYIQTYWQHIANMEDCEGSGARASRASSDLELKQRVAVLEQTVRAMLEGKA